MAWKEVPWDIDWGVDDDYNFIRKGFRSNQFYTNEIVLFNTVNYLFDYDYYYTICFRGYRDLKVPEQKRDKPLAFTFRYLSGMTRDEMIRNSNDDRLPLIHNQVRDCHIRRPFRIDLLYLISLKTGVPIGKFFENEDKWKDHPQAEPPRFYQGNK